MKNFQLSPDMLTMGGQFYPTDHIVAMFPTEDAARAAARALADGDVPEDEISLITPEAMLRDIVRTVGNADLPLPSAGTEADTVRRFSELASQGHFGLLIHVSREHDRDDIMDALKGHLPAHAQYYRKLVIEDLA
ncbi:hypothetical protein EZ313_19155 [Ramlibacter henchirensis]|uniref:Uncharacterized protein n=1 Tax=Ramlibacter henchirensis TaxID=204072 RepID=A0A4Z0BMN8_9BURK|nr:hypothetical protein [Ramlibacter henchirensis]TFZ00576.1 hypothetical protein EZ313_19155 [Ramlibacter henchirensis]